MENDRSNMYLDVRNIEANGRQWLEDILGRPLADDEQVYIMACKPPVVPDEAKRREARKGLLQILDKTAEYAKEHGITAEEADAAVEEAMEHVRHRDCQPSRGSLHPRSSSPAP